MIKAREILVVMFTDIVGYTSIMGQNEKMALSILKSNKELHINSVNEFNGCLVKELGDGMLMTFKSSLEAIETAIQIHSKVLNTGDYKLRIGIHLGEVIIENGDIFGNSVNVASRIQNIALPNSIYISESVYLNLKNNPDLKIKFIKEYNLKNVENPIKIYEIINAVKNNEKLVFKNPIENNPRDIDIFRKVIKENPVYIVRLDSKPSNFLIGLTQEDLDFEQKIVLYILDKNCGIWSVKKNILPSDYEINNILLEKIKVTETHLFFVFESSSYGTSMNGITKYYFWILCFANNESFAIPVEYVISEFAPCLDEIDSSISPELLNLFRPFIEEVLGSLGIGLEDEVNSKKFLHIDWLIENKNVYNELIEFKDTNDLFEIKFLHSESSLFPAIDEYFSDEEIFKSNCQLAENEFYKVSAGFALMVVALDKKNMSNFIIWIPQGYPAGGAWGVRSFSIEKLEKQVLTIFSEDFKLEISLDNGQCRSYSL